MIDASADKVSAKEFRSKWIEFIHQLQNKICKALEDIDGKAKFIEDMWQREEDGGGGSSRIIQHGNVFEKGGVNTSVVYGDVTDKIIKVLNISPLEERGSWFAAGISSVMHPLNPFVPTIHFNYRMFELYDKDGVMMDRWFGGGADLTPYYLFEEDATHFHQTLKNVCDDFDKSFYPLFKKHCDDYFVNTHRNNERRGIGGIFYDYKRDRSSQIPPKLFNTYSSIEDDVNNIASAKSEAGAQISFPLGRQGWAAFAQACGNACMDAYIPLVEKRKNTVYNNQHKHWQEIRRGRYVEFNLIHDRGTLFGLKTGGRTESILMSLPPTVKFEYNYQPAPGSEEDKLLQVCLYPKNWIDC